MPTPRAKDGWKCFAGFARSVGRRGLTRSASSCRRRLPPSAARTATGQTGAVLDPLRLAAVATLPCIVQMNVADPKVCEKFVQLIRNGVAIADGGGHHERRRVIGAYRDEAACDVFRHFPRAQRPTPYAATNEDRSGSSVGGAHGMMLVRQQQQLLSDRCVLKTDAARKPKFLSGMAADGTDLSELQVRQIEETFERSVVYARQVPVVHVRTLLRTPASLSGASTPGSPNTDMEFSGLQANGAVPRPSRVLPRVLNELHATHVKAAPRPQPHTSRPAPSATAARASAT